MCPLFPSWRDAARVAVSDQTAIPKHGDYAISVRNFRITAGDVVIAAALNQTATADLVWAALPIEAPASTWGDEVYFGTPVEAEEDDAQEVVELGDVGFWPPGQALCLFFGPTPASRGDEIRPASAVNVIGIIEGDPTVLRQVRSGDRIVVERA